MSASVKHTHPSSSKQRHVRVASWQDIHHYEEEEGDGEEVYALEKTKAVKYSFSVKDFRKLGGDDKVLEETIKDPRLKAVIKKKLSSQEKPLSLSESGFTARSRTPSQSSKRSMKKPSLVVGSSRASSTAPKTINENDNYYGDDEDADNTDYPDSLLFPGYSFETDLLSSAFGMAIDPTINAPQLIERLDDSQKQAFESYVEKKYRFGSRFSKFKSKTEMKLVKDRYQKKRFLDKLKTALQSKQTELKKLQTSLSEQKKIYEESVMGLSTTSRQIDQHIKTNLPQFMKSLKLKVKDHLDLNFLSDLSIPEVLPIPKELIEYKFPKSSFLVLDPQFRAASDEFKRQLNSLHRAASKIPALHSEISTVQYEMDTLDIQHERLKDTEKNVQEECLLESAEMVVLSELMVKEQEENHHQEEFLKKKLDAAQELRKRQEEQRQLELARVLKAKRGIFKHRFIETLTKKRDNIVAKQAAVQITAAKKNTAMGSLLKNTEIIRQHMPRDRSHSKNTNNHKKIGVPSDYPATQPQDDQRLSIVKKIIDEMETRNEDKQYAVELLRMKQAAKRADLEQQQQQQQQQSAGQNGSRLAEQESSKNQQEQQQLVDVYRQVRPPSSISAVQPPLKQKIGKPLPPPNFKLEKRPESASNQTPAILTRAPFTAEPPMAVFSDYDCDVQYRQTIVLTNISSRVNTFRLLPLDPQLEEFFEIQFTPPGRMSAGNTCELTVLFKVPADFQQDLEGEIRCDAEYGGIFLIKIRGAIRKCKPFLITAMGTGFSPVSFNEKEAVEAKPLVKASYDMFAKKRVAERISENEVLLNFGVTLNGSSTRRKLILRNLGALETGIDVKSYSEGGAGGDRRKSIASKFSTQNSSIFFDVKTNGGILPSYGTASLTIEFSPQQDDLPAGFDTCAKDIMASFVINFDREGMHPIIFRCFARREDPPLNLSLNAIDFGICTDEEVYKLEAFLSNTSKAALKFDMYLDPDASCRGQVSHESISLTGAIIANISSIGQLEILPKTAFVQPNDPFRIRFKLKASLNEKHKLDQGQVHFKLPLVLKYISGLTNCEIKMFIKGSVTTNHISFSAPEVGIGKGAFGVDGLCAGSEPEQQQLQRQKSCTNSTSDVMAAASSAAASLSISSINYDSKIDFGKCSTQENIKYAFTITNHSVISQQIELVSSLPVLSIFPAEDEKLVMQIIDGKHTYNLEPQKTHKFLAKFEPAEPGYHEIVVTCTSNKKPKFNFVCYGSGIYPSVKFDSNEIKFADTSLGSFNSIKIPLIHEVIKINRPDHLPWLKNHQKTGGSKKLSDAFSSSSSPSGPYHQSATTEILSESDYAIEYEFLDPIVVDGLAPPPPMSLNAEGDEISKFTYAIDDPVPIHIWPGKGNLIANEKQSINVILCPSMAIAGVKKAASDRLLKMESNWKKYNAAVEEANKREAEKRDKEAAAAALAVAGSKKKGGSSAAPRNNASATPASVPTNSETQEAVHEPTAAEIEVPQDIPIESIFQNYDNTSMTMYIPCKLKRVLTEAARCKLLIKSPEASSLIKELDENRLEISQVYLKVETPIVKPAFVVQSVSRLESDFIVGSSVNGNGGPAYIMGDEANNNCDSAAAGSSPNGNASATQANKITNNSSSSIPSLSEFLNGLTEANLQFDRVPIGQKQVLVIKLKNTTDKEITINNSILNPQGPFFLLKALRPIPAFGLGEVKVSFEPQQAKSYKSGMNLSFECSQVTIKLNGEGVIPSIVLEPSSCKLILPDALVGENSLGTFRIHNPCHFPIKVKLELESEALAKLMGDEDMMFEGDVVAKSSRPYTAGGASRPGTASGGGRTVTASSNAAPQEMAKIVSPVSPTFVITPSQCMIMPGSRQEIQIKFSPPKESETFYEDVNIKFWGQRDDFQISMYARGWDTTTNISGYDQPTPFMKEVNMITTPPPPPPEPVAAAASTLAAPGLSAPSSASRAGSRRGSLMGGSRLRLSVSRGKLNESQNGGGGGSVASVAQAAGLALAQLQAHQHQQQIVAAPEQAHPTTTAAAAVINNRIETRFAILTCPWKKIEVPAVTAPSEATPLVVATEGGNDLTTVASHNINNANGPTTSSAATNTTTLWTVDFKDLVINNMKPVSKIDNLPKATKAPPASAYTIERITGGFRYNDHTGHYTINNIAEFDTPVNIAEIVKQQQQQQQPQPPRPYIDLVDVTAAAGSLDFGLSKVVKFCLVVPAMPDQDKSGGEENGGDDAPTTTASKTIKKAAQAAKKPRSAGKKGGDAGAASSSSAGGTSESAAPVVGVKTPVPIENYFRISLKGGYRLTDPKGIPTDKRDWIVKVVADLDDF